MVAIMMISSLSNYVKGCSGRESDYYNMKISSFLMTMVTEETRKPIK